LKDIIKMCPPFFEFVYKFKSSFMGKKVNKVLDYRELLDQPDVVYEKYMASKEKNYKTFYRISR